MEFSVADAKNKLPELTKAVEDGESVTICRRGVPVVNIVRTKKPVRKKRVLGTLRGHIKSNDPDWWKPMTDKEVEDFLAGRYSRQSSDFCSIPRSSSMQWNSGTSREALQARGDRLAKAG